MHRTAAPASGSPPTRRLLGPAGRPARRTPAQAVTATVIALEHVVGLHTRARANARQALARDQARVQGHAAVAAQLGTVPPQRQPVRDSTSRTG